MSVTLILLFVNLLTSFCVATSQAVMKVRGVPVKMCLVAEAPGKRNQFAKYWYTVLVFIDCIACVVQKLQFVRVASPSGTAEHVARLLNILEVWVSNLDPPSVFSD
jgi:hypothetical protein